jgi:hypothetical protein
MKKKEKMEKIKELVELFLPEGILEYFDYVGYERKSKEESKPYGEVTIILVEKNTVPKLPEEYQDRKIRQKGFKEIRVDDFPVRGKKVKLLLRRRVWQIEGSEEVFKKEILTTYPGTKLEKEFAFFFEGGD